MNRDRDPTFRDTTPPAATDATVGRADPAFGRLDALDFRPRGRARGVAGPRARRPGRRGLPAIAAMLVVAFLVVYRQPLGERIWPQTRAQALRAEAATALAQGRLTAADGSGARERYEAALAIDPDRGEARAGLARVAFAALAQARDATAQGRFADAHASLKLARDLSVPRPQAEPVEALLRRREAAHAGLSGLLADAEAARVAGRLVGDDHAALPLYARVLTLQPENNIALKGREDALGALLQQARDALRAGRIGKASAALAIARRYDPGHVDLPDSEARLNEELDDVGRKADRELRAGRLEQAAAAYRTLAEADANADADAGLERVAKAYAARAESLAGDFRFADATEAWQHARALSPQSSRIAEVQRHIARAEQAHARLGNPMPPQQRARRVAALLGEAAAAEARGDLVTPPGESAFDKLRAARALAPDDAGVRRASARLLPTAKRCFEQQLSNNNLARAGGCLDARAILDGDDAAMAQARRRLSQRWLAVGDERLGAGEVSAAESALAAARRQDPGTPGMAEFERRLRIAGAGARRN